MSLTANMVTKYFLAIGWRAQFIRPLPHAEDLRGPSLIGAIARPKSRVLRDLSFGCPALGWILLKKPPVRVPERPAEKGGLCASLEGSPEIPVCENPKLNIAYRRDQPTDVESRHPGGRGLKGSGSRGRGSKRRKDLVGRPMISSKHPCHAYIE